jgi:predicted RNA methylase
MLTQTQTQTQVIVTELAAKLKAGDRLTQSVVAEIMSRTFGGGAATGKWNWKQATDLIEGAVVTLLLTGKYQYLEDYTNLQALIPHHQVRSQEQVQLQQFSTPLELAWIVGMLSSVKGSDVILEPSAGTGILAAASVSRLHFDKPHRLVLNEISKSRNGLLQELFSASKPIYSVDAEHLNDVLDRQEQPTLIVMNPPFSVSVGRSKRNPDACLKHLRSALLRLQPQGRLVAIVAHWLSPEKYPEYFASLPAQLQLSLFVDGSHYRYHGTTMDVRILVFDKIPQSEPVKSIDLLFHLTASQLADLALKAVPQREIIKPWERVETISSTSIELFAGLPLFQSESNSGSEIAIVPIMRTKPERVVRVEPQPEPKPQFGELVQLEYQPAPKQETNTTDGVYVPYRASAVQIAGAAAHPTALAESIAMAAIPAPYPTIQPLLPKRVIAEGLASHEQLEALLYACSAHSKLLDTPWYFAENGQIAVAMPDNPDGKFHRQGFFVGDGTGCGKGIISALIVLANWCEGRKKAIWVSKNDSLLEDAQRDWQRLGGDAAQVVPLSKFKQGEAIVLAEGILFVTYGGLRTAAKANKKSRVEQIIDWVGTDWDGAICLDESHLLGNCLGEDGERGRTKASAQGLAGTNLIDRLPNARVTYLSATGAAKVSSLSYCQRLGLWQTKAFPFASRASFIASMESSGVSALEIVSQDFKRLGLYLARTLSFEGVKFETVTHTLTPAQREIWDTYAEAFQYIHHQIDAVLKSINLTSQSGKCTNGRAKSAVMSLYESTKQRFFNALLCAAKAPTLIDRIERDLAAGCACVVQLVSTSAALMERKLARIPTSEWGDMRAIDFTPREGIIDYLVDSFPVNLYRVYEDENGNTKSELMTNSEGNPIVSQEALALRDGLLERMSMLPPVNGLLDQLNWHFGHERVAEVTGRSKRILLKDGRYQLSQRPAASNIAETTAFQSDEKQILVFSAAGGTGRSYHADLNCQNQRLRRHYLVEAGWESIGAVQGVGRTHRSNQQQPPEVVLLTSNVKGELRFTATIASRLSSLGAITKGQRSTGNQGLFKGIIDFTSQYAKSALGEFFADLQCGGIEGITLAEFTDYTGLRLIDENGRLLDDLPKMNTFLNRLLALRIEIQNLLFADFERRIAERIKQAKANGTYDRGVETLWADGGFDVVESQVLTTHSSGSETICYSIDRLNKPKLISVERAKQAALQQGFAYYRHRKSGNLAIAHITDQRTKRDGTIVNMLTLYHPVFHKTWQRLEQPDFEKVWLPETPTSQYWTQWQQLIDLAPQFDRERIYLICGLLLPIWGQLPDNNPKVYRLQANDGRVLLGRAIDKHQIDKVYRNFGITNESNLTADDIFQLVWQDREVTAAGKWELQKNFYKGEERLEILAVYGSDNIDWLKTMGCFTEIIDRRTKVFIPIDNAVEVINNLITG